MNYTDVVVAASGDLKDGEMRQVAAGGRGVLLARTDGDYYAVSRSARARRPV